MRAAGPRRLSPGAKLRCADPRPCNAPFRSETADPCTGFSDVWTGRRVASMGFGNEECWAVETSKDGEKWRFFGKAWKSPGEPVLMHARVRYLRFRQLVPLEGADWCSPLETGGETPMCIVGMESETREDVWPGDEHVGLPMLLPGGEVGRLKGFEHAADGSTWRYTLEFRGALEG